VQSLTPIGLLGNLPNVAKKPPEKESEMFHKELKRHDHQMRTLRIATERLYKEGLSMPLDPMDLPVEELGPFDLCRELVSHLYLGIQPHRPDYRCLSFIHDDEKLRRAIKLLDKNHPARDCHKIGVIYVARGQDDQRHFLRNYGATDDIRYQKFLDGLGWEVEMAKHHGFVGGLDRRGTTGAYSRYYASATVELVFHVVTLMPTKDSDIQQIHKKRHVGNDHVQIIYCNDHKEYRPKTITSQFNDAHVVVYPLRNGQYRIQVHRKDFMPMFGPLQDGMVIGEQLLGALVRETALNASRTRRSIQPHYMGPLPTRQTRIKDIITRYSNPLTKKDAAKFLAESLGTENKKDNSACDASHPLQGPLRRRSSSHIDSENIARQHFSSRRAQTLMHL